MSVKITIPERRATRRITVSLDAVLYYNSLMLPECQVLDLSPEGAFVATGGNFLPDQAMLDMTFRTNKPGDMPQRFTAQVVRSNEMGVGVSLLQNDTNTLRRLIAALDAA